jgi:hypothetical protein
MAPQDPPDTTGATSMEVAGAGAAAGGWMGAAGTVEPGVRLPSSPERWAGEAVVIVDGAARAW